MRVVRYDRRLIALGAGLADEKEAMRRSAGAEARELLGHLAALPPRKRAVLTLRAAGHGYGEIAEELGMSERTVERQLLRARAAVRHAKQEALAA